jgi:enoyl-CoA hydratase/carnithine racemase
MDFELPDDHRMLKDLVARFVKTELMPLEADVLAREARGEGLRLAPEERARADEASREMGLGLADEVVPEEELLGRVLELASEIAAAAPLAVASTRAALRAGLLEAVRAATRHEYAAEARLMRTDDVREGVRSVSARRAGLVHGR